MRKSGKFQIVAKEVKLMLTSMAWASLSIIATRYSRTSICDNKVLSHVFYMPVQNHQPKGHGIYFHSANETDYFHSMHIFPDEFLRNHFLWI